MAFLMKSVLSKVQVHVAKPALKTVKTMNKTFQGPGIDSRSQGSWYFWNIFWQESCFMIQTAKLVARKSQHANPIIKTHLIGLAARLVSR